MVVTVVVTAVAVLVTSSLMRHFMPIAREPFTGIGKAGVT